MGSHVVRQTTDFSLFGGNGVCGTRSGTDLPPPSTQRHHACTDHSPLAIMVAGVEWLKGFVVVDGWEKGIQAFEAVATCPAGTFASLREHLLNHRRLVLDLGPATLTRSSFDFRVRSPTYVVNAAPSSTSVASPSSALPRTLPGRLMPGKRRKITSSTSSHPNSTSLRHSVLHQYECDLRDFWLRRLGVLRSRAAAYVELQDLPVLSAHSRDCHLARYVRTPLLSAEYHEVNIKMRTLPLCLLILVVVTLGT